MRNSGLGNSDPVYISYSKEFTVIDLFDALDPYVKGLKPWTRNYGSLELGLSDLSRTRRDDIVRERLGLNRLANIRKTNGSDQTHIGYTQIQPVINKNPDKNMGSVSTRRNKKESMISDFNYANRKIDEMGEVLSHPGISYNIKDRLLRIPPAPSIRLRGKEGRLLSVVMSHPEEVISYKRLYVEVWDYDNDYEHENENSLRLLINNLREKFDTRITKFNYRFLSCVPGKGYVFNVRFMVFV